MCYHNATIRKRYPRLRGETAALGYHHPPRLRTGHAPGSAAKIAELARRAAAGEALHAAGDAGPDLD